MATNDGASVTGGGVGRGEMVGYGTVEKKKKKERWEVMSIKDCVPVNVIEECLKRINTHVQLRDVAPFPNRNSRDTRWDSKFPLHPARD